MKKILVMLAIALAAVSLLSACGKKEPEKTKTENDSSEDAEMQNAAEMQFADLQSFTATTIDGKEFTEADLADKDLTVINVWQTTCPPCLAEMPGLAKLADALPENVSLITWCLDGETESTAQDILKDAGFKKTTLTSCGGDLEKWFDSLMYVPTTIALDNKGNVVGKPMIGAAEDVDKTYREFINNALKEIGKKTI